MVDKTIFPESVTRTCAQCRFFDTVTNIQQRSQVTVCRLKSPQVFAMPGMRQGQDGQPVVEWQQCTVWPLVQAADWCGDFARKPASVN